MYKDLIGKLYTYIHTIHILSTGYLPINLRPSFQTNDMNTQVKKAVVATNPEYDIVLKRLHLYYDIKLVTFSVNDNSDLIIPFPLLKPYSQSPLTLYQVEIITVPTIYQNTKANSYRELQMSKPYIALSEETYISLRHQNFEVINILGMIFIVKSFLLSRCQDLLCQDVIFHQVKGNPIMLGRVEMDKHQTNELVTYGSRLQYMTKK